MLTTRTASDSSAPRVVLPLSNPDWLPLFPTSAKKVAPPIPIATDDALKTQSSKAQPIPVKRSDALRSGPKPLGSSPPRSSVSPQPSRSQTVKSQISWSTLAQPLWKTAPKPLAMVPPKPIGALRSSPPPASKQFWNRMYWPANEEKEESLHLATGQTPAASKQAPQPPRPISFESDSESGLASTTHLSSSHVTHVPRAGAPTCIGADTTPDHDIWNTHMNTSRAYRTSTPAGCPLGVQYFDPIGADVSLMAQKELNNAPTEVPHAEWSVTEGPAPNLNAFASPTSNRFSSWADDDDDDDNMDTLKTLLQSVFSGTAEEFSTSSVESRPNWGSFTTSYNAFPTSQWASASQGTLTPYQ